MNYEDYGTQRCEKSNNKNMKNRTNSLKNLKF